VGEIEAIGLGLLLVILLFALAIQYWYITIPLFIILAWMWAANKAGEIEKQETRQEQRKKALNKARAAKAAKTRRMNRFPVKRTYVLKYPSNNHPTPHGLGGRADWLIVIERDRWNPKRKGKEYTWNQGVKEIRRKKCRRQNNKVPKKETFK